MQCLACRADNKMLLIDVVRDNDTTKVPVIEHQIYMCAACRHIARRVVFSRVKKAITRLPVIPTPSDNGHIAVPRAWTKAVEKVRSKQAALEQRQQSRAV
jgi:hypothetical protein